MAPRGTADFIEAPEALDLGIVNRVALADKLAEETSMGVRLNHHIRAGSGLGSVTMSECKTPRR